MGEGTIDFGPYIIVGECILLLALAILAGFIYRNRKLLVRQGGRTETLQPDQDLSIQELVDRARKENPSMPLNIMLGSGSYTMDEQLEFNTSVRLHGTSVEKTKIVSTGEHPAISIKDAKDCSLANIRIEGAVQCSNGEVTLRNCHIVVKEEGICIEALDGSAVTFSGAISGEEGVAIRAKGGSKVILKPPYALSGDDFIVVDPQSSVNIEDKESDAKEADAKEE
jgi:hypothetical protein